ncbi:carbamoyltransferase [Streptomyces sp. NPDC059456]|uniref:carbamoyltransferase family protein n=1 Tax=Streptomyces sp. NPDC059456 TaxID=3346838 RepID=UPI0036907174
MLIMGINSYFEHPAVALVEDGEVLFAAEDERFTGIKHGRRYSPFSTYLPVAAMHKALAHTGRSASDITEIGYSYHRWDHVRSLHGCLTGRRLSSLRDELSAFAMLANLPHALRSGYDIPHRYRDRLPLEGVRRIPVREWRHHLSHAASAFHCSGWDNALVIVADGAGENACTSVYEGRGKNLRKMAEEVLPNSLGHFYSAVTEHLGFEPFSDEFKVMGLAAYGESRFSPVFDSIVRLRPGGRYTVDLKALRSLGRLLPPRRRHGEPVGQIHMDIAKSAQLCLERALIHVVTHFARTTGLRRLCLAGGTFLNCVANGRLAALGIFDEIFVQPAASDAGTALGAAALSAIRRGGPAQLHCPSMALGTDHDDGELANVIAQAGDTARTLDPAALAERLAVRLSEGTICAVFRGRMEFGPRALGMRSLLASPLDPGMRDRLNALKGREGFRPVAPIVTEEAFGRYFEGHRDPYMLFTSEVRAEEREKIPSAVHADGTARVQTVPRDRDPFLHSVLTAFERLTGHPVLINTSFNVRGKPIIESPVEALGCFHTSQIGALALGSHLLEKTP